MSRQYSWIESGPHGVCAHVMTDVCSGFEPQNYLKDRCRKCFRQKDKHEKEKSPPVAKKERRKSWRDRNGDSGGQPGPEDVSVSDDAELLSVSSYLSATSKGVSSVRSADSLGDTKSMVTAVSGSICEEDRAMTPTEHDSSLILTMKEELTRLREANRQLKEEREEWTIRRSVRPKDDSEQSLVHMLEDRLSEAESSIQDYRDENTVLKCELRELQEMSLSASDQKVTDKLKATESLCDELMEENEQLKAEIKDLQNEVEEMQDQYREEEIEEFRELQRELEQNAKNSRVLQFKLRKAERQKEQVESEKIGLQSKLTDALANQGIANQASATSPDNGKIKELETELRIAKEVSVRLHTELEQTEEKRYKLEDEVFYLKEKIREMQTQNKWREARNKTDNAVKRLSAELAAAAPIIPEGEMSKELRDALEREIDIREQLRFAEEDLKRTQLRLQDIENENESLLKKLAKNSKLRPPMVRSASEGNAHLQLELAEHEVEHLSTKVERLERTNDHLTKKIVELETGSTMRVVDPSAPTAGGEFKLNPEIEKDMSKMLTTISDLERKNLELNMQIKNQELKNSSSTITTSGAQPQPAAVRAEQEKRRVVEAELSELKQTLLKTDNQKLISLATKIEQLNNQLQMANDRCNNLHRKAAKEGDGSKYIDEMKTRVEQLEKQLSEQKAASTINELQGRVPTTDEIEEVCEVLASIESQTGKICKQVEKIEHAQKDERRRSLSKESSAAIIAELANLMSELKNVHTLMDGIKQCNPSLTRRSPMRENGATTPHGECTKCKENEKFADEQQNEIVFYKKKNKDLTNQILQTEDRWTIEIEKQRQVFENEIKNLGVRLADAKRQGDEQAQIIESKSSSLLEKSRALEEQEERCKRIARELEENRKGMQEMETDKKSVREFEIKYKKLESIFEQEREKMNSERNVTKNEIIALKRMADDAEAVLKQTSDELKRKEQHWKSEKASTEREISILKKQLLALRSGEGSFHDERASSLDSDKADSTKAHGSENDAMHVIELKKQISLLEKKSADAEKKLEDLKIANAELRDNLNRTTQGWQKEKEAFQHKTRQTEKIRTVEMDAVQQKFSSRMRIMEDTNKSLHSQLVLARRERDMHKEALASYERKMLDEKRNVEQKEKEMGDSANKMKALQTRVEELEAELERINTDLRLTKEARKADQIVWRMESNKTKSPSTRVRNEKPTAEENASLEKVQSQYQEHERFYSKELDRLNAKVTELTKAAHAKTSDMQKTILKLQEQVRVLEIEKRNLAQNKDNHAAAKEVVEAEAERLQQAVHMNELQKLTRKYRLSSIIDQLQYVSGRTKVETEHPDTIRYIVTQLVALRDEDAQGCLTVDDRCGSISLDTRNNYAPSVSECDGTYDNISQSSFSVRSVTSMPVRSTVRWTTNTTNTSATVNGTVPNNASSVASSNALSATTSPAPAPRQPNGYPTKRSFSTESRQGFDRYGKPQKKSSTGSDAPTFTYDNDRTVEYDKDGRMHLVPKILARTASFDRRSEVVEDEEAAHSRTGSTGTNVLYRIRREELARGGQPSVRMMAKAFESIDEPKADKRGFFSIRKSRSVETTHKKPEPVTVTTTVLKHSLSQMDDGATSSHYGTLPRGGRNPFKNMGSKIVERVRRSLSRSSRDHRDSEPREEPNPSIPVPVLDDKNKKEKGSLSPKKTKRKNAESKARKAATTNSP